MMSFGGQETEPCISYRPLTPAKTRPLSILDSPPSIHSTPYALTFANPNRQIAVKPEDTLPTPRQSLDGDSRENLLKQFRALYDQAICDPRNKVKRLDNMLEQDFEWLRKKGEAGEIPGWNNIRSASKILSWLTWLNTIYSRIDYMDSVLIFRCPTWQHEGVADVIKNATENLPRIRVGGSPDLKLFNKLGVKTPDLVLCDRESRKHAGFPTVVFEVGYSQTQAALNYNAARLLFGSLGKINTVVNVKITTKGRAGDLEELESLVVDVWRLTASVVTKSDVEGLMHRKILTKGNQLASPNAVSWVFSYITTEKRLYKLNVKPRRYQVGRPAIARCS